MYHFDTEVYFGLVFLWGEACAFLFLFPQEIAFNPLEQRATILRILENFAYAVREA
jgi:hypothetical protein